ncbi:MAG: transglycosylase domain-containing protein [Puia sp.]|nr:transglycosylase domain-containing protein [Puia sp.]
MSKPVRIFWWIYFGGLAAFAILVLCIYCWGKLPSLQELENPSILLASEVYADDGTPMGKFYRDNGNRTHVDYKDISPNVINALVATEDVRFYQHSGVDGKGVLRAVLKFGHDGGGSTLTQQLALNMFNGRRSHNPLSRLVQKLKEWIIAIELERNFTKQEILALYLNQVSFSDNVYGIRSASRTFFQKEPDALTVDEAAVLVGMVNNPTLFNPRTNPKSAIERRNTVLSRMATNHYLPDADATMLKAKPIDLGHYRKLDENNGLAPYFRDVIRDDLKKWCKEHKNPATGEPYDLYQDGLKIFTTINPRMQIDAEQAVAMEMPILQKALSDQADIRNGQAWEPHLNVLESTMKNSDRWRNLEDAGMDAEDIRKTFYQPVSMRVFAWNTSHEKDTIMTPMDSIKYHRAMLETAFMAMDPITGAVKAWVGGIDFRTYKFDHVNINTKRQVGSSIKPFLYGMAIEDYGFTPETQCEQVQQYFPKYKDYVPARNRNRSGTVTMATGLAYSTNEVAAYIMKQFGDDGPDHFADFIKQINIPTKVAPYPSLALGACELSLYEMMWGYTLFPSGGFSNKPYYISRIMDKDGNLLDHFDTERKEVISPATAYTMARMMQGPVDVGTARGLRARLGIAEMGGKTGTTNDNSDFWFIGYTPQLLAGVWVGCDDRFIHLESRLDDGGHVARPIWEAFFSKVLDDKSLGIDRKARFVQPENMGKNQLSYQNIIDTTAAPGAQGNDLGNGKSGDYLPDSAAGHTPGSQY